MISAVSNFLKQKQCKLRTRLEGGRLETKQPSSESRATGPDAMYATSKLEEPVTVASALSCVGYSVSLYQGVSVSLLIHSLEELTRATDDHPLCSPLVLIFGHLWQLKAYLFEAEDSSKLKCFLHCVLDNADETVLKVSCTFRAISEAKGNRSVSVNAEKLFGGSESCCAFNLRHYAALFGPSKESPVKIEARLTSVTPTTATTMLSDVDPYVPVFEAPSADENKIAAMRELLRLETEAIEHLRQMLQRERADREAAEAFVDELLQGRLEDMHSVIAEFRAELEEPEGRQHLPDDVNEQILEKDKQVAALKAELRTETHFAQLLQGKLQELHAKKAASELEKRQTKHMLVAAIQKHEETMRQLRATQEVLPELVETFEREHAALAKCADKEMRLYEEVIELRVLSESARLYHEEQKNSLRKQLAQAGRTALSDYTPSISDDASALKNLQEQVSTLEGQVCCGICMERQLSVSFDCGHTTCHDCAISLHECHICRHPIRERHPIYL